MDILGHKVRRVKGHSMEPLLQEGQVCIFKKKPHTINPIVIAEYHGREVVKRIVRIESGKVWLEGDNKSSHHNSIVPKKAIRGVLVWPQLK